MTKLRKSETVEVNILPGTNTIEVISPYNRQFITGAKRLGGYWKGLNKSWVFEQKEEGNVRELVREIYGYDDLAPAEMVTVRVVLNDDVKYGRRFSKFGRTLAYLPPTSPLYKTKCTGVRLARGVSIVSGGFVDQETIDGFSDICQKPGTVLEVDKVPITLVGNDDSVTLVHPADDRQILEAERDRLKNRLARIEDMLNQEDEPAAHNKECTASQEKTSQEQK